jgi:hypothetical protein
VKTIPKIGLGIALGFVILLVISLVLMGMCVLSFKTAEEGPSKFLPLGQSAEVEGIKFTVVEYMLSKQMGDKSPSTEGAQYLFLHFNVENVGDVAKNPPYPHWNIEVTYKGEGVESGWVSMPVAINGRELDPYPFYGGDKIYPGVAKDGWEDYLVPIEFHLEDAKVVVTLDSEKVGWTLSK